MSLRDTLAHVIQGEAGSNVTEQNAVADVIVNRYNSGNFGSSYESILTPGQFDALNHPASRNSGAYSLADQILAGSSIPQVVPSDALCFKGPSAGPNAPTVAAGLQLTPSGNFITIKAAADLRPVSHHLSTQ